MDTVIRVPLILIWLSSISARLRDGTKVNATESRPSEVPGEGTRGSEPATSSNIEPQKSND
jgi:hypothetical protein